MQPEKAAGSGRQFSPMVLAVSIIVSILLTAGLMEWRHAQAESDPPGKESYWIELSTGRIQSRSHISKVRLAQREWVGGLGAAYLSHVGPYPQHEEWVEVYAYETQQGAKLGRDETGDYLPDLEMPIAAVLSAVNDGPFTDKARGAALLNALEVYRLSGSFFDLQSYANAMQQGVLGDDGKLDTADLPDPRLFVEQKYERP